MRRAETGFDHELSLYGESKGAAVMESHKDDLLQIFRRGAEFAQELLLENERLRYRIVQLEQDLRAPTESCHSDDLLLKRISEVEREKDEMARRLRAVEAEKTAFAARLHSIENEMNNLANLYISSHQLHSTLDFDEVLAILTEIIINLIGAEEFAIMLVDENGSGLQALVLEGGSAGAGMCPRREHKLITAMSSGTIQIASSPFTADDDNPLVAIPLAVDGTVVGVIALYRLLCQKIQIEPLDLELFNFLAAHAGTAIMAAKLHADAQSDGASRTSARCCELMDREVSDHV